MPLGESGDITITEQAEQFTGRVPCYNEQHANTTILVSGCRTPEELARGIDIVKDAIRRAIGLVSAAPTPTLRYLQMQYAQGMLGASGLQHVALDMTFDATNG